jgi:electron transport complex protein RnfG
MSKIKFFLSESWLLIVSSFFFGLLIAGANAEWKDRIEYNLNVYSYNKVAKAVLPEAANFEPVLEDVKVKSSTGKELVTSVKKAVDSSGNAIGWAFICQGTGFADKIQLILTVDIAFEKILGYGVLASTETVGYGDKIKTPYYKDQFVGAPTSELQLSKTGDPTKIDSEIIAISGATISSRAVVDMMNTFMPQIKEQMREKGLIGNEQ